MSDIIRYRESRMEWILQRIVRAHLQIDSLVPGTTYDTTHYKLNIWDIRTALEEAYIAGRSDGYGDGVQDTKRKLSCPPADLTMKTIATSYVFD